MWRRVPLLSESDHMRPLGLFSKFGEVCKSLHFGWPKLVSTVVDHDTTLSYAGPLQKTCPCAQKTQGTQREFIRWFVPLTISNGPGFKVLETVFFWSGNCQLACGRGEKCWNSSFSQHRTTATRAASISCLSRFITQYSLKALEGGQALQKHFEGFRVGRRPRAVLQAAIRRRFHRGLWTHLYLGKLAAGIIFFWLRHWYANFEKWFYKEEHFFKVDEGEISHTTNYKRAPGFR